MLNNLSAEIRECYRHAHDCARQAAAQADPNLNKTFWIWSAAGSIWRGATTSPKA
jgi:hypothetical protein